MSNPVQTVGTATGNAGGLSSITATLSSASQAGNFLVAAVSTSGATASTPSGWTLLTSYTTAAPYLYVFYQANAASISTLMVSFGTPAPVTACIIVAEYSNIVTVSPVDQTASIATGSSASPLTNSITTLDAHEELIAFHTVYKAVTSPTGPPAQYTLSSPTNSFTLEKQEGTVIEYASKDYTDIVLGLCDQEVFSTGTYSSGITSSASAPWASALFSIIYVVPPVYSCVEEDEVYDYIWPEDEPSTLVIPSSSLSMTLFAPSDLFNYFG